MIKEYNIQLSDKKVQGKDSETIFQSALSAGFTISHSCLSGKCKSCKAKLISGITKSIKFENGLSQEEINNGYILTCANTPLTDIELEVDSLVDAVLEKSRTLPVKIDSLELLSKDVIRVWVRLPPNSNFKYLAGQYINLIKGNVKRSYSIAGQDEKGRLQLLIKYYDKGVFSKYLFENAKENDLLRIEGPFGTFFKRNNTSKQIILLATGTGISPLKSMLEDRKNNDPWKGKEITLFYGVRKFDDLFYNPKEYFPTINFIPCLSKETGDFRFGFLGYVQDAVIAKKIDLREAEVYACGSNVMINEARIKLIANELPQNMFFSDAFVSSN